MTLDEQLKYRAGAEGSPIPDDLDRVIEGALDRAFAQPKRRTVRRPLRLALLAAALGSLLTVGAVAVSPDLRQALAWLLGSFKPYTTQAENVYMEDQGIRVELVSTLCDENGGVAYLEVTDLTGEGRLDSLTLTDTATSYPKASDGETGGILYAVDLEPVSYTPSGMAVAPDGGWFQADEEGNYTATVALTELRPGVVYLDEVTIPWEVMGEGRLRSRPLTEEERTLMESYDRDAAGETGRQVLLPQQTPAALEGTDLVRLSSMGYDQEGVFHIQLQLCGGAAIDGNTYDLYAYCDLPQELTGGTSEVRTVLEGGKYLDIAIREFTQDLHGRFKIKGVGGWVRTKPVIRGDWTLTFPLELLPRREIHLTDGSFGGVILKEIDLSVRSARFSYLDADPSRPVIPGWPVCVYTADGSCTWIGKGEYSFTARYVDGEGWEKAMAPQRERYACAIVWSYPEAIDPAEVVAVSIGQRYIPLQGDRAGEGSWLEEIPPEAAGE